MESAEVGSTFTVQHVALRAGIGEPTSAWGELDVFGTFSASPILPPSPCVPSAAGTFAVCGVFHNPGEEAFVSTRILVGQDTLALEFPETPCTTYAIRYNPGPPNTEMNPGPPDTETSPGPPSVPSISVLSLIGGIEITWQATEITNGAPTPGVPGSAVYQNPGPPNAPVCDVSGTLAR